MHAISKFVNIIAHGYNVCELKRREEWLTVNGKCKKSKFTYSIVPLFRYSLFRVLQAPSSAGANVLYHTRNQVAPDAESHEEQNGVSHFLIGATTAKLWPLF